MPLMIAWAVVVPWPTTAKIRPAGSLPLRVSVVGASFPGTVVPAAVVTVKEFLVPTTNVGGVGGLMLIVGGVSTVRLKVCVTGTPVTAVAALVAVIVIG